MPHDERRVNKFVDLETWKALLAAGYSEEDLLRDQPMGPLLSGYSRKQVLADGVLVDLTRPGFARLLKLTGIRVHTAMTATAFGAVVWRGPLEPDAAPPVIGNLLVVLGAFAKAARRSRDTDRVEFSVPDLDGRTAALWALIGPGDEGEPVLTIMLQGED